MSNSKILIVVILSILLTVQVEARPERINVVVPEYISQRSNNYGSVKSIVVTPSYEGLYHVGVIITVCIEVTGGTKQIKFKLNVAGNDVDNFKDFTYSGGVNFDF